MMLKKNKDRLNYKKSQLTASMKEVLEIMREEILLVNTNVKIKTFGVWNKLKLEWLC
jgi:hypothetical protein